MSGYKLVPVEPTTAMRAVWKRMRGYCWYDKYKAMLDAAPAVHGEPVAWVTADTVDGQAVNGKPRRIWWENNEGVGMPIYTAPQPSFQLPDFATDPDDSDEVASLWDHGFKRGWNSCLGAVAKAMQPAEQQPAPDVAGLVGVLGQYFDAMDSIGIEGTATSTLIAEAECDEAEARLRLFLAAHGKGGDV